MTYDNWKTRTPEDDAAYGPKPPYVKARVTSWRSCFYHGWTAHRGFQGYEMTCCECAANRAETAAAIARAK